MVGINAKKYVYEEIGVTFTDADDDALAKKLTKLIANHAFFTIREAIILATAQYDELNTLLRDLVINKLKKPETYLQAIQANLINCTQLAVQFFLLMQQIAEAKGLLIDSETKKITAPKESMSNLQKTIATAYEFAATIARYSDKKTGEIVDQSAEIVRLDTLTPRDFGKSMAAITSNSEIEKGLQKLQLKFQSDFDNFEATCTDSQKAALKTLITLWPQKLKAQAEIDSLEKARELPIETREAMIAAKKLREPGLTFDLTIMQNFSDKDAAVTKKKKEAITLLINSLMANKQKLIDFAAEKEKLERDPVFQARKKFEQNKTDVLALLPQVFGTNAPDPARVKKKSPYVAPAYVKPRRSSFRDLAASTVSRAAKRTFSNAPKPVDLPLTRKADSPDKKKPESSHSSQENDADKNAPASATPPSTPRTEEKARPAEARQSMMLALVDTAPGAKKQPTDAKSQSKTSDDALKLNESQKQTTDSVQGLIDKFKKLEAQSKAVAAPTNVKPIMPETKIGFVGNNRFVRNKTAIAPKVPEAVIPKIGSGSPFKQPVETSAASVQSTDSSNIVETASLNPTGAAAFFQALVNR